MNEVIPEKDGHKLDDKEWEERTEVINGRLWMAEANITHLEEGVVRLLAENADLKSQLEEVQSTADGVYVDLNDLKELVRKIKWCVENGVRG